MITSNSKTVAEYVVENYHTAKVFKEYHIDFCYNAHISLEKSCHLHKVNYEELKTKLEQIKQPLHWKEDFNRWELTILTAFIINVHHKYVSRQIPIVLEHAGKLNHLFYCNEYPEVEGIYKFVKLLMYSLSKHLCKEEQIVFPYIEYLVSIQNNDERSSTLENKIHPINQIKVMEDEHNEIEQIQRVLHILFENSPKMVKTNKIYLNLYNLMREFENDLELHTHLENNILFPKALSLENELKKRKLLR